MSIEIIEEQADIYQFPKNCLKNEYTSITIGDLHGNAVKLLFFLFHQGVIQFKNTENPEEKYLEFVQLYNQFAEIVEISQIGSGKIKFEENNIIRYEANLVELNSMEESQGLNPLIVRSVEEEKNYQNLKRSAQWLENSREKKTKAEEALNEKLENRPSLADLIGQFNGFMTHLEVVDNLTLVRLIGDEFADRGSSDYFILKLLYLLRRYQVNLTTLLSNHSNEFITAYERLAKNEGFEPQGVISDSQKPSFLGLKYLLDDGIVSNEEVTALIEFSYKPTLKIIDYTLNEEGIRLFTHAPVGFDIIKHLAQKLAVVYRDTSKEELATTIDKINTKFQNLVSKNEVHQFFSIPTTVNITSMSEEQIAQWPFMYITWNRFDVIKDQQGKRPDTLNGYNIQYVHGHDKFQSDLQQITNLDTDCGKEMYTVQLAKIEEANEALTNDRETNQIKIEAQNYLNSINNFKIIESTEIGLHQKHDIALIDKEFIQSQSMSTTKRNLLITGIFITLGLTIGVGIGTALVLTGIWAPFGLGILGIIGLALTSGGGLATILGAFGFGIAKATQVPPVNTVVVGNEPAFDINANEGSITKLKMLSNSEKVEPQKTIKDEYKINPSEEESNNHNDEIKLEENEESASSDIGLK